MRKVWIVAAVLALAAGPALAQTSGQAPATRPRSTVTGSGQKPIDNGPFTPEASRAYQGGGVILQGHPGGPAPTPEATPPGQVPRNSVPPG